MKVLHIGDIVGKAGRFTVSEYLESLIYKHNIDLVIANGENAAGGKGITPKIAKSLYSCGVDIITSGNHIYQNKDINDYLETSDRIIRPANYPPDAFGVGWIRNRLETSVEFAVINLIGRVNLGYFDCPFRKIDEILNEVKDVPIKIIDFHGETTSEKIAFGWYVDGKVSAVIGTHTHVQTADARILPEGTGYITDVGMCGAWDSVIGVKKEDAIYKFLTQMPVRFRVSKHNPIFCAILLDINETTGKTVNIKPIWLPEH